MVPLHPASPVHLRLRLHVLCTILHRPRTRRALVQHTGTGVLESHRLRKVSPFARLARLDYRWPDASFNLAKATPFFVYLTTRLRRPIS